MYYVMVDHVTASPSMQINLICNGDSCRSMQLSCYRYEAYSCNITCNAIEWNDYPCFDMNIATVYNDYVEDFVYVTVINRTSEYIHINCYSPYDGNQLIHMTQLDPFCTDDICCPYILPKLQNIYCEEGFPCNAFCGQYLS